MPLPAAVVDASGKVEATSAVWDQTVARLREWTRFPLSTVADLHPDLQVDRDGVLSVGNSVLRCCWRKLGDNEGYLLCLFDETRVSGQQALLDGVETSVQAIAQHMGEQSESLILSQRGLGQSATDAEHTAKAVRLGLDRLTQRFDDFLDEVTRVNHSVLERTRRNLDRTRRMTEAATRAIGMVEEFQRQVTEVGQLAAAVDDIMLQTRILSLNARVEAAKAGELGKSFAVVADEVGNLANTTKQVSQRIQDTANQIIDSAPECLSAMEVVDDNCREAELAANDLTERMHHQEQVVGQARTDLSAEGEVRTDISTRLGELEKTSVAVSGEVDRLGEVVDDVRELTELVRTLQLRFEQGERITPDDVFQLVADADAWLVAAGAPQEDYAPVTGMQPPDVLDLVHRVARQTNSGAKLPGRGHGHATPTQVYQAVAVLTKDVEQQARRRGARPADVRHPVPVSGKQTADVYGKLGVLEAHLIR